jgi:hypothetical protein
VGRGASYTSLSSLVVPLKERRLMEEAAHRRKLQESSVLCQISGRKVLVKMARKGGQVILKGFSVKSLPVITSGSTRYTHLCTPHSIRGGKEICR